MRIRSRTTAVAAVLALGIAVLIFGLIRFTKPTEPIYEGKALSEWIAPFCRQTAKGLDAPGGPQHFEELDPVRKAVRGIGSNAVPFLIAKLNHRESGLHREVRQLLEKQPYGILRLTDPNVSKVRAIRALAVLGAAAEPAIPSLGAQLTNTILSEHCVYALSGMSAKGMQALAEQYTNVAAPFRVHAAMTIASPRSMYRGENASYVNYATNAATVAAIIECLCQIAQDRTLAIGGIRSIAIQRLGEFGPMASNGIPVLMEILNSHDRFERRLSIRALGKIQSQRDLVIPALMDLQDDPDPETQIAAEEALREFGYNVPYRSQVPRVMHPPPPAQRKERYF